MAPLFPLQFLDVYGGERLKVYHGLPSAPLVSRISALALAYMGIIGTAGQIAKVAIDVQPEKRCQLGP